MNAARQSARKYIHVLTRALFVESLGEIVYQEAGRKIKDTRIRNRWDHFSQTERRMFGLLEAEYAQVTGKQVPGWIPGLARMMGLSSRIVNIFRVRGLIRGVIGKRRYRGWANRWRHHNPELWKELVDHEQAQLVYFTEECS